MEELRIPFSQVAHEILMRRPPAIRMSCEGDRPDNQVTFIGFSDQQTLMEHGLRVAQDKVAEFHEKIGVGRDKLVPEVSNHLKSKLSETQRDLQWASIRFLELHKLTGAMFALRMHLELEELAEMIHAYVAGDEKLFLDSLCDRMFVLLGTAEVYDMPTHLGFTEISNSNLSKRRSADDPDGMRVRDKGPDYRPPVLEPILKKWRERQQ